MVQQMSVEFVPRHDVAVWRQPELLFVVGNFAMIRDLGPDKHPGGVIGRRDEPSNAGQHCIALRIRSPPGSTKSPHTFSRGKLARSITATRTPRRASDHAITDPAGPPPTTTTSKTSAVDNRDPDQIIHLNAPRSPTGTPVTDGS